MDSTKIKRTTNREQFKEMVELLKMQPDIAKNLTNKSPEQQQEFWENLKNSVNGLGPPFKEVSEWKKVWSDYKSSIKKKLAQNKRSINATGGGESEDHFLTPVEEDVVQLVCLKDSVEGVPGTQIGGLPKKRKVAKSSQPISFPSTCPTDLLSVEIEEIILNAPESVAEDEREQHFPTTSPPTRSTRPTQMQLLQEQLQLQKLNYEQNLEQVKLLSENIVKINVTLMLIEEREAKKNDILQSILEETQRHNNVLEQLLIMKEANSASEFSI